ncbi:MAG: class I SAM-dependent methyltransferase [Vicinamibacterales bacterium]
MRRLDLPELADQPWWPAWARDAMTGYLHEIITRAQPYSLVVPRLSALLRDTGVTHVVDLCSGAGGPWPGLQQALRAAGCAVEVTCSDLAPNQAAARRLGGAGIRFHQRPVSATAVPSDLTGARTMFSALHHFSDRQVAAILADAQRAGVPFAAFEATSRSARGLLATLVIPIAVLVLMPFVRPRDWRALLLTYLPPVMPVAIWWDGVVSTLRTSSVEELRAIVATLPPGPYAWTVEEIGGGPVPILAVCGRPADDQRGRSGGIDSIAAGIK